MKKKSIILTGPNGHLGKSMLQKLLKKYYVIGISRNASNVNIDSELLSNYRPLNIDLEITSYKKIIENINKILCENNLFIFALINNAYYGLPSDPLTNDILELRRCFDGMFLSQTTISTSIADQMKSGGSIINIGSMYGKVSPRESDYPNYQMLNPLIYGAMKAALIQSSKWMSSKYASKGIRVNSVSYGPFPSEDVQKNHPEFIKNLAKNTHLKRIGNANECSGIIDFLISEDATYITGADIPVDGGWTAW